MAADLEEGDTGEVEAVAADLEEGDTGEVEAVAADLEEGDTGEVEAVAADLEEGDTGEVEAVAADLEKADTAPAGVQDDDTVRMPAVLRYLAEVESNVLNSRNSRSLDLSRFRALRRKGALDTGAGRRGLGGLLIGALLFSASRDRGAMHKSVPTVTTSATATVTKPMPQSTIQLEDLPTVPGPFETVQIQGTYPDEGDTFSGAALGGWQVAGLSATHQDRPSGQFTAFIELGQPGRYRLRVLTPSPAWRPNLLYW